MGNEVILYIIAYVTINSYKIASNLVLIVLNLFCYEYNNDVIFPMSPTDSRLFIVTSLVYLFSLFSGFLSNFFLTNTVVLCFCVCI